MWTGPTLEDAWKTWLNTPQLAHLKALPLIHIWGVWSARNQVIFQDKASSPEVIANQGLYILS